MGDEPSIWEVMQKQAEQFKQKEQDLRQKAVEIQEQTAAMETREKELESNFLETDGAKEIGVEFQAERTCLKVRRAG